MSTQQQTSRCYTFLLIIKDGAKAMIVTDKGENATKVRIGKTPFSNRDGKNDISKGRHRISFMEKSRY
jgi:hypothetical protein